jgi:hypothetical protein
VLVLGGVEGVVHHCFASLKSDWEEEVLSLSLSLSLSQKHSLLPSSPSTKTIPSIVPTTVIWCLSQLVRSFGVVQQIASIKKSFTLLQPMMKRVLTLNPKP